MSNSDDAPSYSALATEQAELYNQAKKNPQRVIPGMFIEDAALCEQHAVDRRDDGMYKFFYSTLPDSGDADIGQEEIPSQLTSAGEYHKEVTNVELQQGANTSSATELWNRVGEGEVVTAHLPLVHYIEREDCYIHTDPTRTGFSHGLPVFVYKRRNSDTNVDSFSLHEAAVLWLSGWILEATGFYDPDLHLPMGMVKHTSDVTPELVERAQTAVIKNVLLPDSLTDDCEESVEVNSIHPEISFYPFDYKLRQDLFRDQLSSWRRLYFGERDPVGCQRQRCSHCN